MLLSLGLPRVSLLLFDKLLSIALEPSFKISRSLFQLVIVQQAPSQRFEKCARAHVVSQLFVSLMLCAFGNRNEKLFVERRQTAFNSAQAQRTFARDGPVRQTEREIIKSFGFELRQQRPLEGILERRIDHIGAIFQNRGDETQKARFGIVLVNKAVSRRRVDRLNDLANLVDVNLVRELRPKNNSRIGIFAPDRARG